MTNNENITEYTITVSLNFYSHRRKRYITERIPMEINTLHIQIDQWRVDGVMNQTQYVNAKNLLWDKLQSMKGGIPPGLTEPITIKESIP